MPPVYAIASNVTNPLGLNTEDVWQAISSGKSSVEQYLDDAYSPHPFWASKLSNDQWKEIMAAGHFPVEKVSRFEHLAYYSAHAALSSLPGLDLQDTAFILSTTKGNIEWLDQEPFERIALYKSADILAKALNLTSTPITISHACVSGVTALQYGARLIQNGRYRHVIVTGADRFTQFVLSGFASFQALAAGRCRPFDVDRCGINLGEGAATIILSADPTHSPLAMLCGGASTNDANHISGPSRTGAELALAITRALHQAGVSADKVDAISAHGTATVFNDEMEAKAFTLAGVAYAPLHSLKGFVGHTLGAAGVLESTLLIESIRRGQLLPSLGFENPGVSQPVNVTTQLTPASIQYALKTASGFGGCNSVILWARA